MTRLWIAAASLALTAGSAAATTVTVDFDSGTLDMGTYTEDGFTFTSSSPGGVSLANNCPTGTPNSSCLQFNNNETITVTYAGGAFDVESFVFNAPGNNGTIEVAGGGTSTLLTETMVGNAMTPVSFSGEYDGIFAFTYQNVGGGTGRVDDIVFSVSEIPLPATGLLLLGSLGLFGIARRRRGA